MVPRLFSDVTHALAPQYDHRVRTQGLPNAGPAQHNLFVGHWLRIRPPALLTVTGQSCSVRFKHVAVVAQYDENAP